MRIVLKERRDRKRTLRERTFREILKKVNKQLEVAGLPKEAETLTPAYSRRVATWNVREGDQRPGK